MGDRYILALRCAWCDRLNEDVWYAESSGAISFKCLSCKNLNLIEMDFLTKQITEEGLKAVLAEKGFYSGHMG